MSNLILSRPTDPALGPDVASWVPYVPDPTAAPQVVTSLPNTGFGANNTISTAADVRMVVITIPSYGATVNGVVTPVADYPAGIPLKIVVTNSTDVNLGFFPDGGRLIDGAAFNTFAKPGAVNVVFDGMNWWTVSST